MVKKKNQYMKNIEWPNLFDQIKAIRLHLLKIAIKPLHDAIVQIHDQFNHSYVSEYLNPELDKAVALRGIGVALLISTDEAIKSYIALAQKETGRSFSNAYNTKPKINETSWAKAIKAGANYIRHSSEWRDEGTSVLKQLGMMRDGMIGFQNDDIELRVYPKIGIDPKTGDKIPKKGSMIENVKTLWDVGLLPRIILINPNEFFKVADHLGLTNLDLTLSRFSEFIDVNFE